MKSRLTITLSKDILKKVDGLIDKREIRNRSHAIEHLISKSLNPTANKAVILAGGTRQGKTVAPLVSIGEKKLIEEILMILKKSEVEHVFICAGAKNKQIQKELVDSEVNDIKIEYIEEKKPLGTAGIVRKLKNRFGDESFLVIHGDALTDINLKDLMKFHEDEGTIATIAVKPRLSEKNYGKVMLHGNKIVEFIGTDNKNGLSIINTGIYSFTSQIFEFIPRQGYSTFEKDVFPRLTRLKELSAFIFQGLWFDVSKQKELKKGVKRWKEKRR